MPPHIVYAVHTHIGHEGEIVLYEDYHDALRYALAVGGVVRAVCVVAKSDDPAGERTDGDKG